jgi:hypothetical protein
MDRSDRPGFCRTRSMRRPLFLVGCATLATAIFSAAATQLPSGAAKAAPKRIEPTAQSAPVAPVIPILAPLTGRTFKTSPDPQPVVITGRNFAKGLTLTITDPREESSTFGTHALQGLTPASFTFMATLETAGTYTIIVRDAAHRVSNPITLVVRGKS